MSNLIHWRGWYAIRRLSSGKIELLAGPYPSKRECLGGEGVDYTARYGWQMEFWSKKTYRLNLARLVFPAAKTS